MENPAYIFTVSKKEVNANKKLLASVLYNKMESITKLPLNRLAKDKNAKLTNFKLNLLKNAHLKDRLVIKYSIRKLNTQEVLFNITVSKNSEKNNETICNALFGFDLGQNSHFDMAS